MEAAGTSSLQLKIQHFGFWAGPLLGLFVYFLLPDFFIDTKGAKVALGHAAKATTALTVWMALWWMSETIEIYATSLLPLLVLPVSGAVSMKDAAAPYGHDLIFLFVGGFMLALTMQRWGLHRRIALLMLAHVGSQPTALVAGFMLVAALLSMWVSNTATAVMLLPIAISLVTTFTSADSVERPADANFAKCVLLGIAYGCSIGGMATVVGSPANLVAATFIREQLKLELSFARWMQIGLPISAILLPVAWLVLTRLVFPLRPQLTLPEGKATFKAALQQLGKITSAESVTLTVFFVAATLWVFRPMLNALEIGEVPVFKGLTDTGIAMLAALFLFIFPVRTADGVRNRLLDWETAQKLPWGVLFLFGGGLSLANAFESTGVAAYLGSLAGQLHAVPGWVLLTVIVTGVVFLTELTSNTATVATLVPLLSAVAGGLQLDPLILVLPTTFAASCAFMLPVATPPNAIVFGSGRISMRDMVRAGLVLNLFCILVLTVYTCWVIQPFLMR